MNDPRAAAADWIAHDPDPETRAELARIAAAGNEKALLERVDGALMFGTAGIRAEVGAGPLRMNQAVIRRTTWGVARHLRDHSDTPRVIVGRDARLSSQDFFEETVAVLGAMGCEVTAFPDPVPTPLVAFTARELAADAAVVITASHNPPADNGYKVYATNAVQIVP
ncbi:MAG: phospho-sugar mutase, partial [Acidimicrobiia bacterium]